MPEMAACQEVCFKNVGSAQEGVAEPAPGLELAVMQDVLLEELGDVEDREGCPDARPGVEAQAREELAAHEVEEEPVLEEVGEEDEQQTDAGDLERDGTDQPIEIERDAGA